MWVSIKGVYMNLDHVEDIEVRESAVVFFQHPAQERGGYRKFEVDAERVAERVTEDELEIIKAAVPTFLPATSFPSAEGARGLWVVL